MTPTGQVADGTWQFGVRRTLPLSADAAWALLHDHEDAWLGDGRVTSSTRGEVARAKEADGSILQVRVLPAKTGATIAFHHEKLADETARQASARRLNAALDALQQHAGL